MWVKYLFILNIKSIKIKYWFKNFEKIIVKDIKCLRLHKKLIIPNNTHKFQNR